MTHAPIPVRLLARRPNTRPKQLKDQGIGLLAVAPIPLFLPTKAPQKMNIDQIDSETSSQIADRIIAVEHEASFASDQLEAAKAELGEASLGQDPDRMARAAEVVAERQRDLLRLEVTGQALQRRHAAALDREAAAVHASRWDAFADALERRHAAFDEAKSLAAPFFAAVNAAVAAADDVRHLVPVERVLTPAGWEIMATPMVGVGNLKKEEIASLRIALEDMPIKSRDEGAAALRLREFHQPGHASVTRIEDAPKQEAPNPLAVPEH